MELLLPPGSAHIGVNVSDAQLLTWTHKHARTPPSYAYSSQPCLAGTSHTYDTCACVRLHLHSHLFWPSVPHSRHWASGSPHLDLRDCHKVRHLREFADRVLVGGGWHTTIVVVHGRQKVHCRPDAPLAARDSEAVEMQAPHHARVPFWSEDCSPR